MGTPRRIRPANLAEDRFAHQAYLAAQRHGGARYLCFREPRDASQETLFGFRQKRVAPVSCQVEWVRPWAGSV